MSYQEDSYSMAQKISTHVILNVLCSKICLICMHMMVEEADSERAVGNRCFWMVRFKGLQEHWEVSSMDQSFACLGAVLDVV